MRGVWIPTIRRRHVRVVVSRIEGRVTRHHSMRHHPRLVLHGNRTRWLLSRRIWLWFLLFFPVFWGRLGYSAIRGRIRVRRSRGFFFGISVFLYFGIFERLFFRIRCFDRRFCRRSGSLWRVAISWWWWWWALVTPVSVVLRVLSKSELRSVKQRQKFEARLNVSYHIEIGY